MNQLNEFNEYSLNGNLIEDDKINNNFNNIQNSNNVNYNYYNNINYIDNRKFIDNYINNYNYNINYRLFNNNNDNHFNNYMPNNFYNSNPKIINIINININKSSNIINNDNVYNYFNSIKYKQIEELTNYIQSISMPLSDFLCTKEGIFQIKKYLHKSNIQLTLKVIDTLNKDGLKKVMMNNQGNFFMQKIIKDSNVMIINFIIKYIFENFIEISNNINGNYVIQKIIEKIRPFPNTKALIFNAIKNKETELIFNKYGMHVFKKILLVISDYSRADLNTTIINNIINIMMDKYGIYIFKYFILTCTIEQNKKLILEKIKQNFSLISQNLNSIYAIQFLFKIWGEDEKLKYITDAVINNIGNISSMQFLSYIIDLAIKIMNENDKQNLLKKLFFNNLKKYLNNKHGCIVLYKILKELDLFWKVKIKYFLIECLKNEIYNNKEKNTIMNVISRIK